MSKRFDYVKYDDKSMGLQVWFKNLCEQIEKGLDALPVTREKSLAITKLEEVYMWIGKAIRDDQIKRNGSAPLQEDRNNS